MKRRSGIRAALTLALAVSAAAGAGSAQAALVQELSPEWMWASSTLPDEYGYNYDVSNVWDYDPATAWVENASGDGIGEYVEFGFPEGTIITGGTVLPGYFSSQDIFDKNSAPSRLRIASGGRYAEVDCSSFASSYSTTAGYEFRLDTEIVSDGSVQVSIQSVRSGWKYTDTCISELRLRGYYPGGGELAGDQGSGSFGSLTGDQGSGGFGSLTGDQQSGGFGSLAGDQQSGGFGSLTGDQQSGGFGSLTENEEAFYRSLGYWVYERNLASWSEPETMDVTADDLTPELKAFLMYAYQYNHDDPRITNDGEVNRVASRDMVLIMQELLGSADNNAMQVLKEQYTESIEGDTLVMGATGDFGSAGPILFRDSVVEGTEDGCICIGGLVQMYGDSGYAEVGRFRVWIREETTGEQNLHAFDRVEVRLY